MWILESILIYLVVIQIFVNSEGGPEPDTRGGVKIGLNGKVFSFTTDVCSGGVFFKNPVKPLFICLNGYFLKRRNGCSAADNEMIASSQYACIDYATTSKSSSRSCDVQLITPMTNSDFPTEHTVSFYDDADFLTNLRRYNYLLAVQGKYSGNGTEPGSRFVVVSNTHNTPDVNIGKVCYDGILDEEGRSYMIDLGSLIDFSNGSSFGFFQKKCTNGSVKLDFSRATSFKFIEKEPREFTNFILATPRKTTKVKITGLDLDLDLASSTTKDNLEGIKELVEFESRQQPIITNHQIITPPLNKSVKWFLPKYQDPLIETNNKTAQFKLMQLSGKDSGIPVDETRWYKILNAAKVVVKKILPNNIIPEEFLDATTNYFGYFHRALSDSEEDLDQFEFNTIITVLTQCAGNPYPQTVKRFGQSPIPLSDLNIKYRSSPPQFVSVKTMDNGVEVDDNLKLSPADENKYHPQTNDAVVETMWNLMDISFTVCAEQFLEDFNAVQRMMVYMQEQVFLHPEVQDQWYENMNSIQDYQAYLPSQNLINTMRNMDKFKALIHREASKSFYGYWFQKPQIHKEEFERLGIHHRRRAFPALKKLIFKRKNSIRHKRAVTDKIDYEIWDGLAYCLQMVEEYDQDQRLVERGFVPTLQQLKQDRLC